MASLKRMPTLICNNCWRYVARTPSKDVSPDAVRLWLFPFSHLGRAKQWFYANYAAINTGDKCSTAFLSKFFPMGKTNALRG